MPLRRLAVTAAAADMLRIDLGAEAWVPSEVVQQMRETVAALANLKMAAPRAPVIAPDEFLDSFPD